MNDIKIATEDYVEGLSLGEPASVLVDGKDINGVVTEFNMVPPEPPEPDIVPPGDYLCSGIEVTKGTIVSGTHENLHVTDQNYLAIQSAPTGNYQYVDFETHFNLPNGKVDKLTLQFSGKYSALRGQTLYAFNWVTGKWSQSLKYASIGKAGLYFSVSLNPAVYLDAENRVKIRIYVYSSAAFAGYYDLLRLKVG